MNRLECRLLVLSLFLLAEPAAAEIFKCPDATGKIAYQDSPCDGTVKGWTEQGRQAVEVPNAPTNPATIGAPLRARPVAPRPMALPPIDNVARPGEYEIQPLTADVAKSPVEAWERFIAASRAGDVEKAAGCFLYTSRARYRQGFQQLGPDGLRETAATIGELTMPPVIRGLLAHGELIRKMPDGSQRSFAVVFALDSRTGGWYIKMM